MTATDRAAALELARETIAAIESIPTGFVVRVEERLIKVCRALLAAEAERERLAVCRRLLDQVHLDINAVVNGDSDEGPGHWKYELADFPELRRDGDARALCAGEAIQRALELAATTDTERHDG